MGYVILLWHSLCLPYNYFSKRLSIFVRYFDAGTPQTSLLGNVELPDGCAHTLTEAMSEFLKGSV